MSRLCRRRMLVAGAAALLAGLRAGGSAAAPSDDADEQALLADEDYTAGLAALKGGDAALAVTRLRSALKRFPEAADLHNELGYAYRQSRQLDKAFEHYRRALAINPLHRGAHEYIGETYLLVGDVGSAEKHLAALRSICVLPCNELRELQAAIDAHRRKATATR